MPALPGKPGRAAWAEIAGENGLADLATNLDFHSVGDRDHKSCDIEKSELVWQGLPEQEEEDILLGFPKVVVDGYGSQ